MSCCGCVFRLLLLVLLLCFTVFIVLSAFLPLFRYTVHYSPTESHRFTVTYWYTRERVSEGSSVATSRVVNRDVQCSTTAHLYYASSILACLAAVAGALASLFTMFWMLPGCRCLMGTIVFAFTLLAAMCCIASFGMLMGLYRRGFCTGDPLRATLPLRDYGYKAVEGVGLLATGGLGFILMSVVEAVAYCCVTCCCPSKMPETAVMSPVDVSHEPTYGDAEMQKAAEEKQRRRAEHVDEHAPDTAEKI